MHPAFSVIFFTTASGSGYGLLFCLIVARLFFIEVSFNLLLLSYIFAIALISAGLLASTLHLGHPERAWRAFSQWRSSWLSREAVCAVLTYLPISLFIAYNLDWITLNQSFSLILSFVSLFFIAATVFCTAMIYASLKPIPAWHNHFVVPNYFFLALHAGGYLLFCILIYQASVNFTILSVLLFISFLSFALKTLYWHHIDNCSFVSSTASATGLGGKGASVKLFEAPHSQSNYLMQEMDFRIARKHSRFLRITSILCMFLLPSLSITFCIIFPDLPYILGIYIYVPIFVTVFLLGFGLICERWLFFAEAKHVMSLYYNRSNV